MELLIYSLNACEVIACITGFWYWHKIKNTYWKWFPIYLLIIVINEFLGRYLTCIENYSWNNYLFRFWGIPIQFFFFYWLFYRQAKDKIEKKIVVVSVLVYIISFIVDVLYLRGERMWFFSFSYTTGNLLLVILIINYLLKFINSDEIIYYKRSMMFWVAIGLTIFYLGTFPFYALRNTLFYNYENIFYGYNYIQLIFGCLMYLVFALSFIWGKPK